MTAILGHDTSAGSGEEDKQGKPGPDPGIGVGVALHACAEGCQVLMLEGRVEPGERVALECAATGTILAGVRWVLGERIALAFEFPIDAAMQAALARFHRAHGRVVLRRA